MRDALRQVLAREPDLLYAVVFGSAARGESRPDSDVDVAIELRSGAARDVHVIGRLTARLESAAGRPIDLVLMDEAPPPLAYRVFRDGHVLIERDHTALVTRKARAIVEYLDWKPVESGARAAFCARPRPVVDRALVAAKIATVRDATARVRSVLPASADEFSKDRTAREIVGPEPLRGDSDLSGPGFPLAGRRGLGRASNLR